MCNKNKILFFTYGIKTKKNDVKVRINLAASRLNKLEMYFSVNILEAESSNFIVQVWVSWT